MATFNLAEYETVEERIKKFYDLHPDGRVETQLVSYEANMWIVKAVIYTSAGDQANGLPKATGYAFEIDGQGMAQKTAALETCETSAIGRALANMGLSGNKRASREEMQKAQRGATPAKQSATPVAKADDKIWEAKLKTVSTLDEARALYKEAQKTASKDILTAITLKADTLK